MSIVGPWLNDINVKKRKVKYASAEAKKRDLELQAEWQKFKYKVDNNTNLFKTRSTRSLNIPYVKPFPKLSPPPGRETRIIPSLDTGTGFGSKKENLKYTGTKVIGVSVVHKSCLQPVFSETEAKDFASMRR
jgi:hypothetical protein